MKRSYLYQELVRYLLIVIAVFAQVTCAARGRPGGGPLDQVPPQIIYTFPAADSVNIRNLDEVELAFSERMDDGSVNQSLFISPRLDFEPDWSGWDEVTLKILDTLKTNLTYVVTIGSAAKDQQKNRMKESYQLAFSTGSKIDRGKVAGRVYGLSRQDVLNIYAYKFAAGDTIDPMIQKADYLSQPGEDGYYLLNYLSSGMYRVFAMEDINKNLLLDLNFERIGIPFKDVTLDSSSESEEGMDFTITREDTTPPLITGARALNQNTVLLRFSDVLKSLTPAHLLISDSLNTDTLRILSLAPNREDRKQYYLYTPNQPGGILYFITVNSITDSCGNQQISPQRTSFSTSGLVDTTRFELMRVDPADSSSKLPLTTRISLEFSKAVDTVSLSRAFTFQDRDQKNLQGKWEWEDLKQGFFMVEGGFRPDGQYTIQLRTRELRSVWGDTLPDTTIVHTLFTIAEDDLGSISGRYVSEKPLRSNVFIDILSLRDKKRVKRVEVNADNTFQATWLPEGYYQLSGFLDRNQDGEHSTGTLIPFQYSEPFYMQSDTIRVRKRWETENIEFQIPGVK